MTLLMNGKEVNKVVIKGEVFFKPHIVDSAEDAIKYSSENSDVPVLYSYPKGDESNAVHEGTDLIVNGKTIDFIRVGKTNFVDSKIGCTGKIINGVSRGGSSILAVPAAGEVGGDDWVATNNQSPRDMNRSLPNDTKVKVIGEIKSYANERLICWSLVRVIKLPFAHGGATEGKNYWTAAANIKRDYGDNK